MGDQKLLVVLCLNIFCLTSVICLTTFGKPYDYHPNLERNLVHQDVPNSDGSFNENIHPEVQNLESDVYWRPWKGTAPKDAIIGGYMKVPCGDAPFYLAQVFTDKHPPGLIPTHVFNNSRSVRYVHGVIETEQHENIKVLCAEDPSIVTWISKTELDKSIMAPKEDCVVGGYEMGVTGTTFFGRIHYKGEIIIGKVVEEHIKFLYNTEELMSPEYDILCYKQMIDSLKLLPSEDETEETTISNLNDRTLLTPTVKW